MIPARIILLFRSEKGGKVGNDHGFEGGENGTLVTNWDSFGEFEKSLGDCIKDTQGEGAIMVIEIREANGEQVI